MRCSLLTAAALGFALAGAPDSATALLPPPRVQLVEPLPDEAATGDAVRVRIGADMAAGPPAGLEVKMDWGNGRFGDWRPLVDPDETLEFEHVYRRAGFYRLRALVRSRNVAVGHWTRLGVIQIVGAPLDAFLTPPYLQNVGTDHITIMWEHADPLLGAVEFGQTTDYGRVIEATQIASGFDTFIFKAVLDGLTPDTEYHYRVISGRRRGDDRVFRTAPPGPATFAFGVWSDSQGENRGAYPADRLEPTKTMMAHMAGSGVAFGVTAGDLAENGNAYRDTRDYYLDRVARHLGQTVPFFIAWGNHDGNAQSVLRRFADLPSKHRRGFHAGYGSYSFNYGGCHFICIDYLTMQTDVTGWLETDLQSRANLEAAFTFLFIHVPPYCELWIDGNAFLRNRLVPLMERYGVDVCFSGHTHEYSRGFRHHVHYCVSGGGSWLDLPEVVVADWEHMTVGGNHPIRGVPRPGENRGGGLINEYVRVDVDPLSFQASMIGFEPDGTVIGVLDRFMTRKIQIRIAEFDPDNRSMVLEWIGGVGPFQVQRKSGSRTGSWIDVGSATNQRSKSVPLLEPASFYRVVDAR